MFVYFLLCTDGSTYIGATVDLNQTIDDNTTKRSREGHTQRA